MKRTLLAALSGALIIGAIGAGGCTQKAVEPSPEPQAAQPAEGPEVKVASLLDSEGVVLGSMVIQMLEANGIKTVDKTKFGTPDVVRKALLAGDIGATIDYTGSGQYYTGPEGDPVWRDQALGYATIKEKDAANGIAWLTPSPANNSEYLGVMKDFAEKNGLVSMADLAGYIKDGGEIKLIGDQSWMDNPAGLKAYEAAYGFTLSEKQKVGLSNGVTAQFIEALVAGRDGVNVAEVYATDGGLAEQGIVVLTDDQNVPPVYAPAPVFRQEIIDAYPQIPEILAPVFESLSTETLQTLNRDVAFGGKAGKDVATQYLKDNGFLK